MDTLIIHPTPTAEWQALVEEAELSAAIKLSSEIESYLVFLLMRFSDQPGIVHSILATDFLESLAQLPKERLEALRDVGDKCLLFAGLFPGRARKRRVRISYFIKLGQLAYGSLSETRHADLKTLYADLALQFVGLMDILHTMRELTDHSNFTEHSTFLDLLQAEELWSDTKSPHALKTLKSKTQGFISPIISSTPPSKH